jgi:tetratricopeptide (TPR) repeat protein
MTEVALTLAEAVKRAIAAYERGQLEDAERLANAILRAKADDFDALHLSALIKARRRQFQEALAGYDRALAVRPQHCEALYNRGNALLKLKRFAEALASYDRALVVRPDHAEALNNRGNALQELERHEEALASYDRALAARPDYAEALGNRGVTLQKLGRSAEALASQDRALALRPDYVEAHNNRGNALQALGRFDAALASYDLALAARPDYAEAHNNRGNALKRLKRFDEALASYDRAVAARPDYAEAHVNKSLVLLLTGNLETGWREFEWRWQKEEFKPLRRDFRQPVWCGQDGIEGKAILLHCEQGFGDTIQFCRYVPMLAARGAHVLLEAPAPLQRLMGGLAGVAGIIPQGDKLPHFDLHGPLLSLPLAFGTGLRSIPANAPYLAVPAQDPPRWDGALGSRNRPRIGLAWSGSAADPNRSIRLQALLQLLDGGARFVSLQKELSPDDAAILRDRSDLLHFGDELKDFADTAAVISNLDLVVSIDTSVAHLAGALAKPVWVLLPFVPDWRWLLDREDSPWYPSARLFRQNAPGDWSGVISRVAAALAKLTEGGLKVNK